MAGKSSDRVADQRKEIVDHVIEEMGKGGFSWLKPWADSVSPHNPVTGSTYHGRNRMHLAVMAAIKGYNDPRWVTFNQAKKVGWKLQKGAKSCIVEKWKMYPVKDSGKEKDKSSPATYAARNLSEKDLQNIAKEHNATTDAVIASIDDEVVQIGGYDWIFDGKPANAAVTAVLRERFLNFVEKEILESETGMYFIENDAWLQDDGFSPAEVRAMADELAADERTELVMEVGKDPFITFYPDFAKYLQAERESLAEVSINKGNLMNDRNVADCRNNKLDSLAAKIFMDMDGLQMCTDLAEQMAWECSTERTELAEVLWNGDPEQGIAALEDVAVDDDDCIKQEWMGYKPGTPRFEVWKDFETNFSKDGVSLCELSGFDDYKVEYKDPGPTLSKSEFDKLFGSDVLDENVQKDVSDVNRDDLGSEDER